ncbi:MAG: alpha/beta hydrolase family protein [Chlamydiia bacterium]
MTFFGIDDHHIYQVDKKVRSPIYETKNLLLGIEVDLSRSMLLIHEAAPKKAPYDTTQLLLFTIESGEITPLHTTSGVVIFFTFKEGSTPFFLVDTDPMWENRGLDPYKPRGIGMKNGLFHQGSLFLAVTHEGADLLVEIKGETPVIHPHPLTSIQELFSHNNHLCIAGKDESGTFKICSLEAQMAPPQGIMKNLHSLQKKGWCVGPIEKNRKILIRIHGGPIAHTEKVLTEEILHYLPLDYTLVYPNYVGSTGYGRKHRLGLLGNYGVKDVEEIVELLQELHARGIDYKDIFLKGKSSAGLTAMLAACKVPVAALSIYCPVTENNPNDEELSFLFPKNFAPRHQLAALRTPLILFQGDSDTIISPEATASFVALFKGDLKIESHLLKGVGHFIRGPIESWCLTQETDFLKNGSRAI